MTWVTNTLRAQALKSRKESINFQLLKLSQKLIDLGTYGASIGDGRISDIEFSSMPVSYQTRTVNFMAGTANPMSRAMANYHEYMSTNGDGIKARMGAEYDANVNGGTQGMSQEEYNKICANIYQNFLSSQLEEYGNQEAERIHVEEKKIQQEQLRLETQVKAIEAEYESVSKSIDGDIKNSAIKLAG